MSEVVDWPLGERPDVKSGARAFLDAVGVVDGQVEHAAKLQAAVDDIRALAAFWLQPPTHQALRQAAEQVNTILQERGVA